MQMNNKGLDNYQTPAHVFSQLNEIFSFTTDAACTSVNKLCPQGFCIDQGFNGLEQSWSYHRIFCNPPFSNKDKWIRKAHEEVASGKCPICVMILPLNCMSTEAFQEIIDLYHYDILKQRIAFINPETGKPQTGNNTGTVIVYFMKKPLTSQQRQQEGAIRRANEFLRAYEQVVSATPPIEHRKVIEETHYNPINSIEHKELVQEVDGWLDFITDDISTSDFAEQRDEIRDTFTKCRQALSPSTPDREG